MMPRSREGRCTAPAPLPRKSAAIALPSMIFAVMSALRQDERAGLASPRRSGIAHSPEQPLDHLVAEQETDDEDHRRNVDSAQSGKDRADRPQCRLRHATEEIPDHADGGIVTVDNADSDQP